MKSKFEELYSEAQMAFVNGRYDTAVNICEKAVRLKADVPEIYTLAGNACLVQKQMEEAEKFFIHAAELNAHEGERYFDLANSLLGQQRLSEALEIYAKAVQLGCRDEVMQKIYYLMGVINQTDQKNYKDALSNFEKSEKIPGVNADQADILLKKIQIYVEQQRFEKAENCAIQLKLLMPGEFQGYQLLFQLYLQQKKIEKAKDILDEAEENAGFHSEAQIEIAFDRAMLSCFLAEQNPDQMSEHYENALKQLAELDETGLLSKNDKCEALITGAEIYMKLRQYDEAIKLAELAASHTEPELTEYIERGYYILMNCADSRKNYPAVREYACKLKQSENVFYRHHGYYSEAYAVKKLSEMNQSFQKECTELYHAAIAYFRNAAVAVPGDFLAYMYRAKAYVDLGMYDRAEEIGKLLSEENQKALQVYIDSAKRGDRR